MEISFCPSLLNFSLKKERNTHHIPQIITFFAIIMLLVSIVIKNNLELTVDFLGIVYLFIECIWVGMGKECPSLVHFIRLIFSLFPLNCLNQTSFGRLVCGFPI